MTSWVMKIDNANYTIGRKSAILRLITTDDFCESALNDRRCLAVRPKKIGLIGVTFFVVEGR